MTKSELQEELIALYLRLNGYFTTGLLIHSSEDHKVDGELDIIGVRFWNHKQEDRIIECSTYLEIPNDTTIDVIIGEVKGGKKGRLQFNESIREHNDRRYKMLTWIGLFNDSDLKKINSELEKAIHTKMKNTSENFPKIIYKSNAGQISIRPIIFAPERPEPRDNQIKFISGSEILNFIWACFRPKERRDSCETDYGAINNWGIRFKKLVQYFKQPEKSEIGNIEELYEYFELTN